MSGLLVVALVLMVLGAVAVSVSDDTEQGAYTRALGCVWCACALALAMLAVVIRWRS
jgi:hypothetical protein